MNRKLDVALVKQLKELLGTSGKRIAVYFKEGAAWPQILTVYRNETPPTRHPNHADFAFAGWADLNTGSVTNDITVDTGARPGITWKLVLRALLGLFMWIGKVFLWCVIGLVMIVSAFTGGMGHSRSGYNGHGGGRR